MNDNDQFQASIADSDWIQNPHLQRLLNVLGSDEDLTRIAGGAVRNSLLGLEIKDIDLATTLTPDEVVKRCQKERIKTIPTGIKHGTVTAVISGQPYEITTLRVDVETDGRHATVEFSDNWQLDAERRDFTVNGLYARADGSIVDLVDGINDLRNRRIRFIGNANKRIEEDYLRILRFFRFSSFYGDGELDAVGLSACVQNRKGLLGLSRERIGAEVLKILQAKNIDQTAKTLDETGLASQILGGVVHTPALTRLAQIETDLSKPIDPILRLAVWACRIQEDAERLSKKLRLSNQEKSALQSVLDSVIFVGDARHNIPMKNILYHMKAERFARTALYQWACFPHLAIAKCAKECLDLAEKWTVPDNPIKADTFLKRGYKPGEHLGTVLRQAEELWMSRDFSLEESEISAIIDEITSRLPAMSNS